MLVLTFHNLQHLAEYMHQTITHTRRTGNDYAASILSRAHFTAHSMRFCSIQ